MWKTETTHQWNILELIYCGFFSFAAFGILVESAPKQYLFALGPAVALAIGAWWFRKFGPFVSLMATLVMSLMITAGAIAKEDPLLDGVALFSVFTQRLIDGGPIVSAICLLTVMCVLAYIPRIQDARAANGAFFSCFICTGLMCALQHHPEYVKGQQLMWVAFHRFMSSVILYTCVNVAVGWEKDKFSPAPLQGKESDENKSISKQKGKQDLIPAAQRIATRERLLVFLGTVCLFLSDYSLVLLDDMPPLALISLHVLVGLTFLLGQYFLEECCVLWQSFSVTPAVAPKAVPAILVPIATDDYNPPKHPKSTLNQTLSEENA